MESERTDDDAPGRQPTADELLAELIRNHEAVLMAYVVRLTGGDRAWAEDVLQETFLRAWRHLDRLTAEHGSVRSWLSRVAHNIVMDGYRASRSRPVEIGLEAVSPVAVGGGDTDHVLDSLVLRKAMETLSCEHIAALTETYLCDRTAVDAARVLKVPVGTVKSRVYYGIRRLRTVLDQTALAS